MPPEPLEHVIRNVDARLTRVEQILPTLPTKQEMQTPVAEGFAPLATREDLKQALAPLATKAEMHEIIAGAVAPLATREDLKQAFAPLAAKDDLRRALAEEGERSRRHLEGLIDLVRADIRRVDELALAVLAKLEGR